MLEYSVLLVLPIAVYGFGIYFIDTIIGRVEPNKVSWLMWSLSPLIAAFAAFSRGVVWPAIPIFVSGLGPFCIFVAAFFNKKAYWKSSVFDYLCGFCAVLALALWSITKEANVAIIFAMVGDIFASVPTLKKAWTNPETEVAAPYITSFITVLTSFVAIKYWAFEEYAFPMYLIIMDACLIFSVFSRKILKKRAVKRIY
jgi:hypothetical protein